jgi:hypothetical protein
MDRYQFNKEVQTAAVAKLTSWLRDPEDLDKIDVHKAYASAKQQQVRTQQSCLFCRSFLLCMNDESDLSRPRLLLFTLFRGLPRISLRTLSVKRTRAQWEAQLASSVNAMLEDADAALGVLNDGQKLISNVKQK